MPGVLKSTESHFLSNPPCTAAKRAKLPLARESTAVLMRASQDVPGRVSILGAIFPPPLPRGRRGATAAAVKPTAARFVAWVRSTLKRFSQELGRDASLASDRAIVREVCGASD